MKLELLPKGKFSLLEEGSAPVKGCFSMYAIDNFCQLAGVNNYFNLIERISTGMSVRDYATLLMCALNEARAEDDQLTVKQAMGIFDDVFDGIEDPDFIRLIYHAIGRISTPAALAQARGDNAVKENEEKKSSGLTGGNLSAGDLKPD